MVSGCRATNMSYLTEITLINSRPQLCHETCWILHETCWIKKNMCVTFWSTVQSLWNLKASRPHDKTSHTQKRSTNISQRPDPTGMSEGFITQRKRICWDCCALRSWQGVQMGHCCRQCAVTWERERRIHSLLLRQIQMNLDDKANPQIQIQMNSDDKTNPQIPKIKYNVNLKQKRRKSVTSSCAHQSGLRKNLGLARVASYSVQDPCVRNFWIIFVCWQSLAKFFTTSCRWQPFTKFRIVVALHHPQECSQHQREDMLHQALANLFASISHCVWKLASFPTASYPRQVSYTINRSPSALVSCAGRCCCRDCELFFSNILDFSCLDPFIIVSFDVAYVIFGSFRYEEVIDFIFPSFLWSYHSFLLVKMSFSSLISISFFCVFGSSIGFLLFSSVPWLHLCFSSCIKCNVLLQFLLPQFLHRYRSWRRCRCLDRSLCLSCCHHRFHPQSFRDFLFLLISFLFVWWDRAFCAASIE